MTPQPRPSYTRELVAQITQSDPATADMLFTLFALTDSSTPKGAAARADVLDECFYLTGKFRSARDEAIEECKRLAA